jgi:hypothetical protein
MWGSGVDSTGSGQALGAEIREHGNGETTAGGT